MDKTKARERAIYREQDLLWVLPGRKVVAFVFIIIGLLQSPSFGSGLVATYTVVLVRKKESLLLR